MAKQIAARCSVLRTRFPLLVVLLGVFFVSPILPAQNQQAPGFPTPSGQIPIDKDEREAHDKIERDMAKKANKERYVALKRDTDKLLDLATQLKQNVDKSSEATLSLDVVKKAEEIEKLAHSVKEKMKGN